jgi:ribosomal protein L21E
MPAGKMTLMAKFKEGDRVRVTQRPLAAQDSKVYSLFEHMMGLTGVIENHYGPDEVAVKVDLETLGPVPKDIHAEATRRMRTKFVESVGEEARKQLSPAELEFVPNYVILVREADIEKI